MIALSENFVAAQALRKEYARKLLMFEIHMQESENDNKASKCDEKRKIREYCMSTPNKRKFIMHCCLATSIRVRLNFRKCPQCAASLLCHEQPGTTHPSQVPTNSCIAYIPRAARCDSPSTSPDQVTHRFCAPGSPAQLTPAKSRPIHASRV